MENSGTIERFCDSAVPRLRLHLYRPSDAIHSCMRKKGNRNSFRKPSFHLALYGWNTLASSESCINEVTSCIKVLNLCVFDTLWKEEILRAILCANECNDV